MTVVLFASDLSNHSYRRKTLRVISTLSQEGKHDLSSVLGCNLSLNINLFLGEVVFQLNFKNYIGRISHEKKLTNAISNNGISTIKNACILQGTNSFLNSAGNSLSLRIKQQEGKKNKIVSTIAQCANSHFLTPLAINKKKQFATALIDNKPKKIVTALPYEIIERIINDIREGYVKSFQINNALVEGVGNKSQRLITAFPNEIIERIINDIREGIFSKQNIATTIDAYQGKKQKVVNEISTSGISKTQTFRNAIEQASYLFTQSIQILLDGKAITDMVTNGSINLYGKGMLSDCNLDLKTVTILTGEEITIKLGTKIYSFLLEEESYNAKDKTLSLWGRSKSAQLYEPLAVKKDYKFKNRMASYIAQEVCQGWTIDWQIDDWLVPFYEKENAYPLEIVNELANTAGAVVRAMPDGIIHVVYPYFDEPPELNLELPLSLTREKKIKEADGVRVIYSDKDKTFVVLEADKTEVRPGEWAEIRVYCLTDYNMHCTSDVYFKAESGVIEEVEEDVILEGAEGSLSKPVLEVVSVSSDKVKIAGQKVYCRDNGDCDCLLVSIRYKTRYDLWRLTNYTESKALFCAVETESSWTVLEGTGERIEEVEEPLINDSYLARRRAEKELTEKKGLKHLKVTIPFEEMTCNPVGLCVSTPYGRGVVIGNTISFTAKPIKVVNQLEVLLWPQ